MKKIGLIIAFSLVTAGSYAQNKCCNCKHKYATRVHHKAAYTHRTTNETTVPEPPARVGIFAPTCLTYKKDNIVVTECPDIFYDNEGHAKYINNSGALEYQTESSFSGYYPVQERTDREQWQDTTIERPQNTEMNQGTYDNMYFWYRPKK